MNINQYDYRQNKLSLNTFFDDTVYENISADEFSTYMEFETAFANPAIAILTDSTSLNYFPTDVLSDSLPIGFYTYEISLDEDNQVDLTFRIDD